MTEQIVDPISGADNTKELDAFLSDAPSEPEPIINDGASSDPAANASSQEPPVPPTPPVPTDGAPPTPPPGEVTPSAEPVTPAPPVAEPVLPVKTKDEEYEETIVNLRKQVEDLAGKVSLTPVAPVAAAPVLQKDAQGNVIPPAPTQPPVFEFVKDEAEFDGILKSAGEYNKHLTGVMYKTIETVFRAVPKMMSQLADQQVTARLTVKEFYDNNKDLVPNKAFVGMVANEIAAKNPDWNLEKVMGELGKEVRTRLRMGVGATNIQAPAPGGTPPSQPPITPLGTEGGPAFAGGSGARRGSGSGESALQKEINDLITD